MTRPLAALRGCYRDAPPPSDLSAAVVVCTRDRPDHLERCLRSLEGLDPTPTEVVVVDNAPTTGATKAVVGSFPAVTYVKEPRPGLSVARNTALAHTAADVVAFTDDDVTVHPRWLARLVAGFDKPGIDAVTGLVLPAELDTPAQMAFQRLVGGFDGGYRALVFGPAFFAQTRGYGSPVWRIGAGANMAVRRETVVAVGGFDERLGAGAAGCSEDSELWYRLLARGGECRYEPDAVVFHHHRRDTADLEVQAYQYMRGHVAALWIEFASHGHWGNVRRALGELPTYFLRQALAELPGSGPAKRRVLTATYAGYLAGLTKVPLALSGRSRDR